MTKEEIAAMLAEHKLWIEGKGGKRARLDGVSLVGASLDGARLDYARLDGARLDGASLVGARLDGARLDYARLDYARLVRARLDGASLVGASLVGARLDYARLDGASLVGAKINDKTSINILRRATRSDGYEFFLWHCQEGFYVKAGCHFFTTAEARQHWTATRAGTSLGDESLDILDFFDAAIKRQGGAA